MQPPLFSTTLMSPLPLTQQPFSTPLSYTASMGRISPTPPQPYAMSQFTSPRIPPETLDYIFMELHRLRDCAAAQDHLIQSMSQEITHLRSEVASLTATVTAAPRTTPEVEEQIVTIQTAIEETTKWVDVARQAPKAVVSATIAEQEQRASKALNIRV